MRGFQCASRRRSSSWRRSRGLPELRPPPVRARASSRRLAAVFSDPVLGGFAPGHSIPWFEPELGYIVVVLDGAMRKTFSTTTWSLERDSFATLPSGAGHSTDFGLKTTHVLTIHPSSDESGILFAPFLRERRQIAAPAAAVLGRRLAHELQVPDASSVLAAEGLVLQLLAMGERETSAQTRNGTLWLSTVVDVLHGRTPHTPSPVLAHPADRMGGDAARERRAARAGGARCRVC